MPAKRSLSRRLPVRLLPWSDTPLWRRVSTLLILGFIGALWVVSGPVLLTSGRGQTYRLDEIAVAVGFPLVPLISFILKYRVALQELQHQAGD